MSTSTTLISYEQYEGILQSSKTFLTDMDTKSESKLLNQISYAPNSSNPTTLFTGDADTIVQMQTQANSSITGYIANVQTLVNTLKSSLVAVADITFLHEMINGDPKNIIFNPEANSVLGIAITNTRGLKEAVAEACTSLIDNSFAGQLMSALRTVKESAIAYQTFANDLSVVMANRPSDISIGTYNVTFPACKNIQDYWISTMNDAIFSTTTTKSFTKDLKQTVKELINPSTTFTSNTAIGVLINRLVTTDQNYLMYLSNLNNLYLCAQDASSPADFKIKAIPILTKFYNNLMNTRLVRINKKTSDDPVVNTTQGFINLAKDYVKYLDIKILIHAITGYNYNEKEFDQDTGFVTSYPVIANDISHVNESLQNVDNYNYQANENDTVNIAILVPDISGDALGFFPVHQARTNHYGPLTPARNFMKLTNCSITAFESLTVPVNFYIEPDANPPYQFVSMFSGIELFMQNSSNVNEKLHSMGILPQERSIQHETMPWNVWDFNLFLIHSLLLVALMELKKINIPDLQAYTQLASVLANFNGTFNPMQFKDALLNGTQLNGNYIAILDSLYQSVTSIEIIATICAYLRESTQSHIPYSYTIGDFDTKNSPILATNIRSIGEQFNITY
jgi:hypothetical protein